MKHAPFLSAAPIFAALLIICSSTIAFGQSGSPAPLTTSVAPPIEILNLTCDGGGTAARSDALLAYGAPAYSRRETYRGFEGQMDLRLFSADDRIRLPPAILAGARAGKSQWFKVKKLEASDREITGHIIINVLDHANVLNAPRFRIDRESGGIEIVTKTGGFSGACKKIDAQAQKPKF
jgi:hypothetical protein